MKIITVNTKGQITLGKELVKHLGAHPGDKVVVEKLPNGRLELKAMAPIGDISDVFGFLKRKGGPSLSLEDINKLTIQGWSGKR